MKIIVFGGAFDPPHLGHLQVIEDVLQHDLADEVWLVPTGKHDFDKNMTADEHRVRMLEILIENLPGKLGNRVKINTSELSSEEVNQTIDTLDVFSEKYPQHEFYWLMGSDNLKRFDEWNEHERIIKDYQTLIYPRKGYEPEPWYEGLTLLEEARPVNVSSTEIRQQMRRKKKVSGLVLPEIEAYIQQHNLYQN